MAKRPVFIPREEGPPYVEEVVIEFAWVPGMAKSQVQKSIDSLHEAAAKLGFAPTLEISSKSREPLGVALSAFNLELEAEDGRRMTVECAFQGSKVFARGGPYEDLYLGTSRDAKRDERLGTSGEVVGFRWLGRDFPIRPRTAFYDWLYLRALGGNPTLAERLREYAAFSDMAFNPARSLNCQARSAALYVALERLGFAQRVSADRDFYLRLLAVEHRTADAADNPLQLGV